MYIAGLLDTTTEQNSAQEINQPPVKPLLPGRLAPSVHGNPFYNQTPSICGQP